MPPLTNARHERFAQELAKGKRADEALAAAGIPITGEKPRRYYVYVLIDPRDMTVFYVGKGKGRRMHVHYSAWKSGKEPNKAKSLKFAEVCLSGKKPLAVCLQDDLDEKTAYQAERHVMFRLADLTNRIGAPIPEAERASFIAKEALTKIRPYCRMFRLTPAVNIKGWEQIYWGVIAELKEVADGAVSRVPASRHNDIRRALCQP